MKFLIWSIGLIWIICLAAGCHSSPRDISAEPHVQRSGIVRRMFVLSRDATLQQVKRPYPRVILQTAQALHEEPEAGGPSRMVGTVRFGTPVTVVRVERALVYQSGLIAMDNDLAFGRIESGEHAGKVVEMGWRGWLPSRSETPDGYEPLR
jgi:hypothetical protein